MAGGPVSVTEFIWNLKRLIRDGSPKGLPLSTLESKYKEFYSCFPLPAPAFIPGCKTCRLAGCSHVCKTWEQVFQTSERFKEWFRISKKKLVFVLPKPEKDLQVYFRLNCYTEYVAARQGAKVEGLYISAESSEGEDDGFDIEKIVMGAAGGRRSDGEDGTDSDSSSESEIVACRKGEQTKVRKSGNSGRKVKKGQPRKRVRRRRSTTSVDSDLMQDYERQLSPAADSGDDATASGGSGLGSTSGLTPKESEPVGRDETRVRIVDQATHQKNESSNECVVDLSVRRGIGEIPPSKIQEEQMIKVRSLEEILEQKPRLKDAVFREVGSKWAAKQSPEDLSMHGSRASSGPPHPPPFKMCRLHEQPLTLQTCTLPPPPTPPPPCEAPPPPPPPAHEPPPPKQRPTIKSMTPIWKQLNMNPFTPNPAQGVWRRNDPHPSYPAATPFVSKYQMPSSTTPPAAPKIKETSPTTTKDESRVSRRTETDEEIRAELMAKFARDGCRLCHAQLHRWHDVKNHYSGYPHRSYVEDFLKKRGARVLKAEEFQGSSVIKLLDLNSKPPLRRTLLDIGFEKVGRFRRTREWVQSNPEPEASETPRDDSC